METEEPVYRLFTDIFSRFIIKNTVVPELPMQNVTKDNLDKNEHTNVVPKTSTSSKKRNSRCKFYFKVTLILNLIIFFVFVGEDGFKSAHIHPKKILKTLHKIWHFFLMFSIFFL